MTSGFYGHISTVPGGSRNGYVEHLVIANSTTALKFDSSSASTLFAGTFTVGRLDSAPYTDPETGLSYDGNDNCINLGYASTVRVLSGRHVGSIKTQFNSGSFLSVTAGTTYHIGENGGFYYQARHTINSPTGVVVGGVTFDVNAANYLLSRSGLASEATPVVHLYGVVDGSPVGKKGTIPKLAGAPNTWEVELHLHSSFKDRHGNPGPEIPCVIGCLLPNNTDTQFPTKLFVDANQTFGLRGTNNRAQIIAAYLAAGKVQGTPANPLLAADGITPADFYIHPETWIVSIAGVTVDVPESLK
jgi:hypothetical protein